MTRNERLLTHIDIYRGEGLEIGALCSPVVPRDHPGISYVDHLDTVGLHTKYEHDPNVNIEQIVPVRYVWAGGSLVDVVGSKRFAYVVGSHVMEHVPDLIGWLQYVSQVIEPRGLLALVVPDMRYTFDCQRNLTSLPELLESYFLKLKRPSFRQILDHFVNKVDIPEKYSITDLWENPSLAKYTPRSRPCLLQELGEFGLRQHFESIQNGEYIDAHCSVFTPRSFVNILSELTAVDMCHFTVRHLEPTLRNEQDFSVILEPLPECISRHPEREYRQKYILERLPIID